MLKRSLSIFPTSFGLLAGWLLIAAGEEKPPEKKEPPKILLAAPLAVTPGSLAKVTLRGARLDQATEVLISGFDSPPKVELKKKEKAGPPNGLNANEVGDSFVELEFTLPETLPPGEISLMVNSEVGMSQAYLLRVLAPAETLLEKEPNEAFRKAGKLAPGQIIVGGIHQQRDVDVFQIEAGAGQSIAAEVFAARRGSALDPLLSLYDARGQLLGQSDDQAEHRDAVLKHKFAAAGTYYLTLIDAHDRGSNAHPYLLQLRAE